MANLVDELEREIAHADFMAGIAQHWMERARAAERTLAIVVKAAGGKVVVHPGDLIDAPNLELIKIRHDEDMTVHFVTRMLSKDHPQ